jgi:hypothetical protein
MAEFLGVQARHAGQQIARSFHAGQEAAFAFGRGTLLFNKAPVEIYGRTEARTVTDATAYWFEFGFRIDTALTGNGAAGYTDAGNYFRLEIEQSEDLVNWSMGKFLPAPVPVVDCGGGVYEYWSRCTTPVWWFNVLADLTLTSNRYGKSITGLSIGTVPISLPGYPYAMPASAATLQADLRAASYPGATVTHVSAALTVGIINHTVDGRESLTVTLSGGSVTGVATGLGASIPLPGYPYAMPAQRATLQTDLRAAGQSGAVVKLYGDAWTILLPDRPAPTPEQRGSIADITPDDPYPEWNFFNTYLGVLPDTAVVGTSGNIRPGGGGGVIPEALKQFARLKITRGTRHSI